MQTGSKVLASLLLSGMLGSSAFAAMTVETRSGMLSVTSDVSGTVMAKVIGPNDEVLVNDKYEGDTFAWSPSGANADGAYRYDVRVVAVVQKDNSDMNVQTLAGISNAKSDYAGGSVEIVNGSIVTDEEEK